MISRFCSVLGVPLDTRMYLVFPDAIEVGTMEVETSKRRSRSRRSRLL